MRRLWLAISFLFVSAPVWSATWYISPLGNDSNGGTSCADAELTHAAWFTDGTGGDTYAYCSTDTVTTYTEAINGAIIGAGDKSARDGNPPNGSVGNFTIVKATGDVRIVSTSGHSPLFLGGSATKASYQKYQGIRFEGGGQNYNTDHIYISSCAFHSAKKSTNAIFTNGTADGNWGNTNNLIEDSWVWGQERVMFIVYRASQTVVRRVVIRGDGCDGSGCIGSGNPNVGITVYDSSATVQENVLVVDRILGGGYSYADFATAQHGPAPAVDRGADEYLYNNYWLGCLSLNSLDSGFYMEADNLGANHPNIINSVVWNPALNGFNLGSGGTNFQMKNLTAYKSGGGRDTFRIMQNDGQVRNIIAYNSARYGINSATKPAYVDVYGSVTGAYNQTTPTVGVKTTDPTNDGTPASVKYPMRIEAGSVLAGAGESGVDIGANIIYEYGVDGAFWGDTNYNTLSAKVLWPWRNEARIKADMCESETRGFCSSATLTNYIMGVLGNTDPYSDPDVSSPTAPGQMAATPGIGTMVVTSTGSVDDVGVASYRLDVSTMSNFSVYETGYQDKTVDKSLSYTFNGTAGITYYARMRAVDYAGNTSENSSTVSATPTANPATTLKMQIQGGVKISGPVLFK